MTTAPAHAAGQRSPVLLVAAALLVVVTVALVLVFGVLRPPTLASLAEDPSAGPSAAVAWMAWDGGEGCVTLARPSGVVDTRWCSPAGGEVIALDGDEVVVRTWETGERLRTIDLADGQPTGWIPARPDPAGDPVPDAVLVERTDGLLTVRAVDTERVVWQVEAHDDYTIDSSALSPDGGWILLVDAAGRLLVVPSDGVAPPRVWAEDVPAWPTPVWEGARTDG